MSGLIDTILSFPVIVFTIPLGLSLLYWVTVIVGAVDVDLFGIDGAAEGIADGAAEGLAEGAVEGAAEAAGEGAAEGVAESASSLFGGLISALKLRAAPITVVGSLFFFWGWLVSLLATRFLSPVFGDAPHWIFGSAIFFGTFVAATLLTSGSVRPLAPVFQRHRYQAGSTLVGQSVIVKTTVVDERLGQATYDDGGSGLLFEVRAHQAGLKRGEEAVIIEYDKERGVYWVEPMRALLEKRSASADPVPAASPEGQREPVTEEGDA